MIERQSSSDKIFEVVEAVLVEKYAKMLICSGGFAPAISSPTNKSSDAAKCNSIDVLADSGATTRDSFGGVSAKDTDASMNHLAGILREAKLDIIVKDAKPSVVVRGDFLSILLVYNRLMEAPRKDLNESLVFSDNESEKVCSNLSGGPSNIVTDTDAECQSTGGEHGRHKTPVNVSEAICAKSNELNDHAEKIVDVRFHSISLGTGKSECTTNKESQLSSLASPTSRALIDFPIEAVSPVHKTFPINQDANRISSPVLTNKSTSNAVINHSATSESNHAEAESTTPEDDKIADLIEKYAIVEVVSSEDNKIKASSISKSKMYELSSSVKFSCDLCSFVTRRRGHYERHTIMHRENPVVFVCPEPACGFRCIRNGDLTRHRTAAHCPASSLHSCVTCKYVTTDKRSFDRHIKYQHEKNKKEEEGGSVVVFTCRQCTYKTTRRSFLVRHMKRHSIHIGDVELTKRKLFHCDHCKFASKRLEHLKRHRQTVHSLGQKLCICDVCGASFKRKDILGLHMRRAHGQETSSLNQHTCHLCGKVYKSRHSLKEHAAMHQNRKDVQCDVCSKAFNTAAHLRKHKNSVHNTPGYTCDVCNKVVNTPFNLKRHKERHKNILTDSNPYSAFMLGEGSSDSSKQLSMFNVPNSEIVVSQEVLSGGDGIPIHIIVEDTVEKISSEITL